MIQQTKFLQKQYNIILCFDLDGLETLTFFSEGYRRYLALCLALLVTVCLKGQVKIYLLITRARKQSKTLERWPFLH